jgi:hypothetical protein
LLNTKSRGKPADMGFDHEFDGKHGHSCGTTKLHRRQPVWQPIVSAVFAAALAGCSSAGSDGPAIALPKMPDLSVASIGSSATDKPVGSATEIYARVARGANTCWFVGPGPGQAGPLKKDYIYHAEADAPSRGGKAEIVIHARDLANPNPRGAKSYRINIDPDGEGATLKTENLKMSEAMSAAMTADVNRWAKGDQGCAGSSTVAGWGEAQPPAPAAAPPPVKKKTKVAAKTAPKTALQAAPKTTKPQ